MDLNQAELSQQGMQDFLKGMPVFGHFCKLRIARLCMPLIYWQMADFIFSLAQCYILCETILMRYLDHVMH